MAARKKKGPKAETKKIGCVQHDCSECLSRAKREAEVLRCLKNAEPLIRGQCGAPIEVAHHNIVEALGMLNTAVHVERNAEAK